ncbi:complex I subunit 4 family protein [Hugenholtzia roseola]|uniref:complex I subunit 4 family protein n=1 Tax=Hugenholtzia roseola TaxID=1002 RepID=UPI0004232CBC|nr:NADH-quinone oxidoreductase subunit M [Hugenholtzia roseola]
MLSFLLLLPLSTALIISVLPKSQEKIIKSLSLLSASLSLGLALWFWFDFEPTHKGLQAVVRYDWFEWQLGKTTLKAYYFLGLDGLNLALVLLSTFLLWLGVGVSWQLKNKVRSYFALYFLLSTSILGCFLALDFLLFFLFFEFMLLPMYFLISLWGGKKREAAALKFFIYTLVGSVFILMGGLVLVFSAGDTATFDMMVLKSHFSTTGENFKWAAWVFWAFLIGFAIKLPAVPLHTWLPLAHVEASTPISMLLAGVLLKMGGYGLLRLCYGILPQTTANYAWQVGVLGLISLLYGAWVALGQKNLKKLIAYSSVSHMGFVLLGVAASNPEGISGALFHMIAHGLIAPLLFLMAGTLYERTQDLSIEAYSGLAQKMPNFSRFLGIAFFAALGMPMLAGFIGEVTVIFAVFASAKLEVGFGIGATLSLVLSAGYFLWTLRRLTMGDFWYQGAQPLETTQFEDLTKIEIALALLLILPIFFLGIYPAPLFESFYNILNIVK